MTRSEQIQKQIDKIKATCEKCKIKDVPGIECCALKLTLELFLDEQKRSEGCPYCKHHGEPSAVVWDTHKIKEIGENEPHKSFMSASMYTRKGEAELVILSQGADNKQNQIRIPARHCLHCGRDLTEGESV